MNTKNNLRFQETEQKIQSAFLQLLSEQPLHTITVGVICKKAAINRSTFYAHHENAEQLLSAIDACMSKDLHSIFEDSGEVPVPSYRDRFLMPYLQFLMQHKDFYRAYFQNAACFDCRNDLYTTCQKSLLYYLEEPDFRTPEKKNLILSYYTAGIFALIREWVQCDCAPAPDEVAEMLQRCVTGIRLPGSVAK